MDVNRFQEISFAHLPVQLDLTPQAVHIWCTSLDLSGERLYQLDKLLSEDEQARAQRFRFQRDRHRFIAGRGTLRLLLARYLHATPAELRFSYSSQGKPALTQPDSNITFNVSHSQDLALYAVTCDRPIGIDIEYIRSIEDLEQLAQRYFLPRENALIQAYPPEQRQQVFFRLWTCKEAYLKATGEGITGLRRVAVGLEDGNAIAHLHLDNVPAANWTVLQLHCHSDFAAALAVEGKNLQMSYYLLHHPD